MIHEYDLLNALVAGTAQALRPDRSHRRPAAGRGDARRRRSPSCREVFAQDNVAVVREGQKVVAIVTKIDLIEFLAERAR